MWALLQDAEAVLRPEAGLLENVPSRALLGRLIAFAAFCGVAYGIVMGSFAGWGGDRVWQALYAAVKVPILLLGTFVICLPSFFVLNTVAGLRPDFNRVLQVLLRAQAGMTIVLCSLSPFTILWYLSSANYHAAVLFNGMAFGVASAATQMTLRRLYHPLIEKNGRHRLLLHVWLLLYVFVGVQLGWLLRPFVGQPDSPVQLFRANAWGNAYVEILHHVAELKTTGYSRGDRE